MGLLSNSSGNRKKQSLSCQILRNWDSRSRKHSKKPVVTVGPDLLKVRKYKWHLGTKWPNKIIREIVGVEQLTENTEEIHSPMETDPESNEISRK